MIMSILNGFGLTNLVSFCMKILNSVVVVGLYYGFLSAFSIGPSYLLLIRARVMKERNEKVAAAITEFILGQLTMFVSGLSHLFTQWIRVYPEPTSVSNIETH